MSNTIEVLSLGKTKICFGDLDEWVILPNELILEAAKLIKETADIDRGKDDEKAS